MPEREILTPREALARYRGGPRTGVLTDGSCEGNPGRGGWGFVWVEDDEIRGEGRGTDSATTNNRMELTALIRGLRALPEDAEIAIYSDSEICVKTVNEWAPGWEARGWRRKGGQVATVEHVKEADGQALAHPRARIQWIKSHDGSRWNEYADALAASYLLGEER